MDPDFDDCPDLTKSAPALIRDFQVKLEIQLKNKTEDAVSSNEVQGTLISILEQFQDSPQLLDPILAKAIDEICRDFLARDRKWHCQLLYTIGKVRGVKTILQLYPNEVNLVPVILKIAEEKCSPAADSDWIQRYVLLQWLASLVLTPFNLETLGYNIGNRIYELGIGFMGSSGREREASIILLSRFLARTDALPVFITKFLSAYTPTESTTEFELLATASIIAQLYNLCSGSDLANYQKDLSNLIERLKKVHASNSRNRNNTTSANLRKILVKASYRSALSQLALSPSEVPKSVETVLDDLMNESLHDKDTLVRYSASKAFSRIVIALKPLDSGRFSEEVLEMFFGIFSDFFVVMKAETVDSTHGGLLALAELLRRKAISLHKHSSKVEIFLASGLRFNARRTTHSVGTNVRDAACYASWSLFRHYRGLSDKKSAPEAYNLASVAFKALLLLACFDREINNRRAAAAAVQECIGRHGAMLEVDDRDKPAVGLDVVQALDYFELGNRSHAFLVVSVRLQRLGLMHDAISFLLDEAVASWDADIRRLGGRAIAILANESKNIEQVVSTVFVKIDSLDINTRSESVNLRHGYFYTLGELLNTRNTSNLNISSNSLRKLEHLFDKTPISYFKSSLHGFLVYESALHLIAPSLVLLTEAKIAIPEIFTDIINESLMRTSDDWSPIYEEASRAILNMPSDSHGCELDDWISSANNGRPGFITALSNHPTVRNSGEERTRIINILYDFVKKSTPSIDIAIRVNSIKSLANILSVDISDKQRKSLQKLSSEEMGVIEHAFLIALQDYTVQPPRGDVGSLLRIESLRLIKRYARSILQISGKVGNEVDVSRSIFESLVRISLEKMDKLRIEAVEALKSYTYNDKLSKLFIEHDLFFETQTDQFFFLLKTYLENENIPAEIVIRGVSSSTSRTASESVIRASRDAVVRLLTQRTESSVISEKFLGAIVPSLLNPTNSLRTDFEIAELFGCVVIELTRCMPPPPSPAKSYVSLFNKLAKMLTAAIKTKNIQRQEIVATSFIGLVGDNSVATRIREEALKKVAPLLVGDSRKVRQTVADSLYLLISSENLLSSPNAPHLQDNLEQAQEILESVDWANDDNLGSLRLKQSTFTDTLIRLFKK
ncbi:armadillo-type protein [Dipodascopsis uninucleata]